MSGDDTPVKIRVMATDETGGAFQKAQAQMDNLSKRAAQLRREAAKEMQVGPSQSAMRKLKIAGSLQTMQQSKAEELAVRQALQQRLAAFKMSKAEELSITQRTMFASIESYKKEAVAIEGIAKQTSAKLGPGGLNGAMMNGLGMRETRHILRMGGSMALGAGGGEVGSIASMGLMIGGGVGVAVAGLMMIGEGYKASVEQAKKLVEETKEYNKQLRESAAWWAKQTAGPTTSLGGEYRGRAQEMKEKAAEIRDKREADYENMGLPAKSYAGYAILARGDNSAYMQGRKKSEDQERMAGLEASYTEHFSKREEKQSVFERGSQRYLATKKLTTATMAPGVARQRQALKDENEAVYTEHSIAARRRMQAVADEHELAVAKAKQQIKDEGSSAGKPYGYVSPGEKALYDAERKFAIEKGKAKAEYADVEASDAKDAGLKKKALDEELKRSEKADAAGADQAMIGATERGYAAKLDVLKRGQQQELDSFTGTADQRLALVKKQSAETRQLQREEDDALEEMAVHAAQTRLSIANRAAVNVLRNDRQEYAAKIQEIKNQRDETNQAIIDKAEIDRERDPKKAVAIDKQAKLDLQKNKQGANQEILQEAKAHAREVENIEWETKQQQMETADKFNVMMLRAGHKFYEADKAEIENHLKEKTAAIQAEADRAIAANKTNAKQIQAGADAKKQAATLDAAAAMKSLQDQRLRESLSLALPQGGVSGHLTGAQAISREMNNPGRALLGGQRKDALPMSQQQGGDLIKSVNALVDVFRNHPATAVESLLGQEYGGN